jgi:hypothetical protein
MNIILTLVLNLITAWITSITSHILRNKKYLFFAIKSFVCYRNKDVRVSISYLFKMKVDGKYFLIKGNRIDQFQPVGGVFKFFPGFKCFKFSHEVIDDDGIPIDENSKNDLRIRIKGKHLLKLMNWFLSRKDREVSVHREFYEEIIRTGILSNVSFINFNPEYYKTETTKIHYSEHFGCNEVIIYEIYNVEFSKDEEKEILNYIDKNPRKAILVNRSDIKKECVYVDNISKKIGQHAKHIL